MEVTTKDILVKARELISNEENWTQRLYGISPQGWPVEQDSLKEAVCFCATGAIIRAMQILHGDDSIRETPQKVYTLLGLHHKSLILFNDPHSHKDVLALFDTLISDMRVQFSGEE